MLSPWYDANAAGTPDGDCCNTGADLECAMKGRSERDHDDEGEPGRFCDDAEPGFPGEKGGLRCRTEIVPGTKSAASGSRDICSSVFSCRSSPPPPSSATSSRRTPRAPSSMRCSASPGGRASESSNARASQPTPGGSSDTPSARAPPLARSSISAATAKSGVGRAAAGDASSAKAASTASEGWRGQQARARDVSGTCAVPLPAASESTFHAGIGTSTR